MMNPSNLSTSQLMRKRNGKKWGITKAIHENDPNFSDEWIEDLSLRVNTCYANIESYFHDRKDDPPSSKNSISARKKEVEEWR